MATNRSFSEFHPLFPRDLVPDDGRPTKWESPPSTPPHPASPRETRPSRLGTHSPRHPPEPVSSPDVAPHPVARIVHPRSKPRTQRRRITDTHRFRFRFDEIWCLPASTRRDREPPSRAPRRSRSTAFTKPSRSGTPGMAARSGPPSRRGSGRRIHPSSRSEESGNTWATNRIMSDLRPSFSQHLGVRDRLRRHAAGKLPHPPSFPSPPSTRSYRNETGIPSRRPRHPVGAAGAQGRPSTAFRIEREHEQTIDESSTRHISGFVLTTSGVTI